jgi:hypothetical protein
MIAKPPTGTTTGQTRLAKALQRFTGRTTAEAPDCQKPGAPADLPLIHGLQLAGIEARLTKLEQSVSNQNKLLVISIIAVVGELAKSIVKP